MIVFLDLDGVCAFFVKAACQIHSLNHEETLKNWTPGIWHMEDILGISSEMFWEPIKEAGEGFWSEMPLYSHAEELYAVCKEVGETFICTTPINHPSSAAGKVKFLHRWLGKGFRDYVLVQRKELLAGPDRLLVDDSDKNVAAFRKWGGHAILFPQVFNSNHSHEKEGFAYTKDRLQQGNF